MLTCALIVWLLQDLGDIQKNKNGLINKGQINNPSIYDFDLQIVELIKQIQELIRNNTQINKLECLKIDKRLDLTKKEWDKDSCSLSEHKWLGKK